MPSNLAPLSRTDVDDHIRRDVFGLDRSTTEATEPDPRTSVGIELEWLTVDGSALDRLEQVRAAELRHAVTPLPGGARFTIEPGGQLELSSPPFDTLDRALAASALDLYHLDRACADRGVELVAIGADPERPPRRILDAPRYAAMERFFDADGAAGRTMMCNTASVQVNVGLGRDAEVDDRWCVANAIGPTLVATFANSPFADGRPSGWRSTRMRSWLGLDQTRAGAPCTSGDPVARYVQYVLDARVMLIQERDNRLRPITTKLTFGEWMACGHELGWPELDDLRYHLTTLFPPVRPKGWFEIRTIDALPTPFWQVAAAATHALLTEPAIADDVRAAVAGTETAWSHAAQHGLSHPNLERAATSCLDLAVSVLDGRGDAVHAELVGAYLERWTRRGRSPGDDLLDEWHRSGRLWPSRRSPILSTPDLLVEIDRR